MGDTEEPGIRERSRRAMRAELTTVAQDLFLEYGFDQVTVDQIADAARVSKRTLFRYFSSKEDIIVGSYDRYGDRLVAALNARPACESAWDALWAVFKLMVTQEESTQEKPRLMALEQIVQCTPQLTARFLEKIQAQQRVLVEPIRARMVDRGYAGGDPRPAAVVGAAFACLYAARSSWLASGQVDGFSVCLDQAMSCFSSAH